MITQSHAIECEGDAWVKVMHQVYYIAIYDLVDS